MREMFSTPGLVSGHHPTSLLGLPAEGIPGPGIWKRELGWMLVESRLSIRPIPSELYPVRLKHYLGWVRCFLQHKTFLISFQLILILLHCTGLYYWLHPFQNWSKTIRNIPASKEKSQSWKVEQQGVKTTRVCWSCQHFKISTTDICWPLCRSHDNSTGFLAGNVCWSPNQKLNFQYRWRQIC